MKKFYVALIVGTPISLLLLLWYWVFFDIDSRIGMGWGVSTFIGLAVGVTGALYEAGNQ